MSKSKTRGRPQIMINKHMLRNFTSIVSKSTVISQQFNAGRNLVVRCVKHEWLRDILRDPDDDNMILQVSREDHQFHKIIDSFFAAGYL